MTYLSYPNDSDVPVASDVIDDRSRFQPSGACYTLKGIALGYNVTILGGAAPDGLIVFDRRPAFRGVDFTPNYSDTGRLHLQDDGTVAIEWPL